MKTTPVSGQIAWPLGINQGSQLLQEVRETRREAPAIGGVIRAMRRLPLLSGAVVLFLLLCALSTAVGTAVDLASFRDVGYPDSSDLLRIGEFVRSGHIYPDGDRPPYLISLYGPLTYVVLSIPYRLARVAGITPQVMVRLGVLSAVCLCVFFIYLINRRLYSSRPIAWLCTLFAVSALPMAHWTTQMRGDFFGLAVSLLSIYWFLLKNGRPQTIGAAISAGFAPLFKQTFFAAPIAIIGWLIYRRRYKEAASWAATVALTVAAGYAIVWWREPLMLKSIAALRHPVLEYPHARRIFFDAVSQPVVPFAVMGALLAVGKGAADRLLLLIYCLVAWFVALVTIPQAGSSINYFWEPLFTAAVLAGPGLCAFQCKVSRTPLLTKAMVSVLLLWSFVPMLREELGYLSRCYANVSQYQVRKARWESFISVVSGRRLLSTIPDVTLLSSTPEIPDPFLNATLEHGGGWNSGPIAAQIEAGAYDLIVIRGEEAEKHEVPLWSDRMWSALKRTYEPACVYENDRYVQKDWDEGDEEIWLPRRGAGEILSPLVAIGCQAVTKRVDSGSVVARPVQ